MSSRTNKAIKGTVTSFLQYVVYIVLQALLAPLVLKVAGQETLGAYSILMQIIGYGILLDLGFSVALSRYLAQTYSLLDQKSRFSEVFTIGRVFLLVTNMALATLILLVAFWIEHLIVASNPIITQARVALYFLAVWSIIRTPVALYNHALMATQNMTAANVSAIIGNISRLLLSLGLVYAGMGLLGLVLANIFAEGLTFALQMKMFKRRFPEYILGWNITNRKLFKEMFSFGVRYFGVNVAVVLFLGSDSIIVGNLYGASVASVFYTTKIPTFLLFQFIFRISDNSAPAANDLLAQGKYDALRSAYLKILRYSMLLALPLAIGIVGFNERVIAAWVGPAQFAGDIMTIALAIFVVTQVINHINAMITLAAGDMRGWSALSIVTSITCLAFSYWLGKMLGMQWVMVGIALMDFPSTVFLFRRSIASLKLPVIRIWSESFKPAISTCFPLFALVVYLKLADPTATLFNLTLYILLFAILWGFSVIAIGLNGSEREMLRNRCQSYLS